MRGRMTAGALGALVLVLAGCGPPAEREPWPDRPVVELGFTVAPDLRTVTGHERVTFTPDQRVCELVFRTWPNEPNGARSGSSLVVTGAAVGGRPVQPRTSAAGAPEGVPGTLVDFPLPECREPGESVTADLDFRLVLGPDADDRWGMSPSRSIAWFGGGFPLLAWVRGQGWARDDATELPGETATSEDFELAALAVTAPARLAVTGTGTRVSVEPGPFAGTRLHRFQAPAVRDVVVTAGDFETREQDVAGTRMHLAFPRSGASGDGIRVSPDRWADKLAASLLALERLLGPYPYPDLWVTVVPTIGDGIEFPTAVLFGDLSRHEVASLAAHELAHEWFYALVGNNQAADPWIDESFATFAQALVARQEDIYALPDVSEDVVGELGQPMAFWARSGGYDNYVEGVYTQGAAVLLEARRRVGAERFDRALREYVRSSAHRVVAPADVFAAFRDLPPVTDLLRQYGVHEGGNR